MNSSIKKIRKKLGISQIMFGKAIGVSTSAIANYENDFRKPRPEIAFKILDFAKSKGLKLNLEDIYTIRKQ
jgi:DNA-binding XRE family transcriptional regulator